MGGSPYIKHFSREMFNATALASTHLAKNGDIIAIMITGPHRLYAAQRP